MELRLAPKSPPGIAKVALSVEFSEPRCCRTRLVMSIAELELPNSATIERSSLDVSESHEADVADLTGAALI